MTTSYNDVTWSDDEPITAADLNKMTNNDKYLYQHMLPAKYSYGTGSVRTEGVKIASGVVGIVPQAARQAIKEVYFGSYFTPGCKPIVQVTLATSDQQRSFISVLGLATGQLTIDHTGFRVVINADPLVAAKTYFPRTLHVHWLALGY